VTVEPAITDLPGVRVGHWSDPIGRTGCTVLAFAPEGAVASGMVLGAAPGSRESALLAPEKSVERIHALLLTGGSAFGLDAAGGVMRYLDERGIGFPTPFGVVPIVPAAVLYDLSVGDPRARPTAAAGYQAICDAMQRGAAPPPLGAVGVATGATVGKIGGYAAAERSGLGYAAMRIRGAIVAALAVSNALGDLFDPADGTLVAGSGAARDVFAVADAFALASAGGNTTLVAVVTDAPLAKAEAHALALTAHVGIAQVTRPSHTSHDGDTAFVASTMSGPAVPVAALGVAVQAVVAQALLRGARLGRSGG
jgi:L-aminopeptidase/D-esterase-like protein